MSYILLWKHVLFEGSWWNARSGRNPRKRRENGEWKSNVHFSVLSINQKYAMIYAFWFVLFIGTKGRLRGGRNPRERRSSGQFSAHHLPRQFSNSLICFLFFFMVKKTSHFATYIPFVQITKNLIWQGKHGKHGERGEKGEPGEPVSLPQNVISIPLVGPTNISLSFANIVLKLL